MSDDYSTVDGEIRVYCNDCDFEMVFDWDDREWEEYAFGHGMTTNHDWEVDFDTSA